MLNITVLSAPAPLSTERSSSLDSGTDWQSLNSAQAGGGRGPSRHLNTALKGLKALKALKVLKVSYSNLSVTPIYYNVNKVVVLNLFFFLYKNVDK